MPVTPSQAVESGRQSGPTLRRASEISLTTPDLDLARGCRVFQRALRSRVERRDALLEIVRAVNTTLEPAKIAELIVERAATWVPAPCWAVVSSDLSGQLSVLADRGLTPDMGPARLRDRDVGDAARRGVRHAPICGATRACRRRGGRRGRSRFRSAAAAAAIGALIASIATPSSREPRLAPSMLRAVRVLLEPAAVALDNALLLKRAEALSVTDDLTQPVQLALPEPGAAARNQARVAQRPAAVAAVPRPRRVQGGQRHATATCPAAARWSRPRRSSAGARARPTSWRGSAATSSRWCCPTPAARAPWRSAERIRERIAAHTFLGRRRARHPPDRVGRRRDAARRGGIGRGVGPGRRRGDVPGQRPARTAFRSRSADN